MMPPVALFTAAPLRSALVVAALLFAACSVNPTRRMDSTGKDTPHSDTPHDETQIASPAKRFPPATETDKLLDAKPHTLPEVKPASAGVAAADAPVKDKPAGGPWRIQVGALPDLESAQARKRELDPKLGGGVELTFDAPYYKLRWGGFATKQEAEDKLLEMSEVIREGFVIRQ